MNTATMNQQNESNTQKNPGALGEAAKLKELARLAEKERTRQSGSQCNYSNQHNHERSDGK